MSYMGNSASGKACKCEIKDKNNWEIVGRSGKKKIIRCHKCHCQWNTSAKYIKELED